MITPASDSRDGREEWSFVGGLPMTLETTPDIELWSTLSGGGGGLATTDGDSTHGLTGYDLLKLYQNSVDNTLTTSVAEGLYHANDVVIDSVHGKFFIADSDSAGHNRILQGNIADVLNNPGAAPNLTILYSDSASGAGARIDNLEIDPNNGIVYFTHGDNFEKVAYNSALQTPVVLFNANVTATTSPTGVANPAGATNNFYNDVAINFATGDVYLSSTRVAVSSGGDIVSKNFIYHLSGLTSASGTNAFTFGAANSGTASLLTFSPDDDQYNPEPGTTASPATTANEPYFFPVEHGSLDGLAIDVATNTLYFSTESVNFDPDGDGLNPILERGGIFSYALTGNPTGTYSTVYQETSASGPQGLLGDLEIDAVTGKWYAIDFTGGTAAPGDEGVWTGNLNGTGSATLFQLINNASGQIPSGLTIDHAPTVSVTDGGAAAVETPGSGSGFSAAAAPLAGIIVSDFETASNTDQLTGATVRIADYGVVAGAGERLTIAGNTSGTLGSGIAYSFNSVTGTMTLSGVGTFASYQAALSLVSYSVSGDNPDGYGAFPTREIAYAVSDGLLSSDEHSVTVDIAATNDAPVNTVGSPLTVLETDGPTAVTGLAVSDPDANPASDAIQVTLSATLGTIDVSTAVAGGITAGEVSGNGTGTVVITATQNEINATFGASGGVTYDPATDGADTLTMTTSDLGNRGAGGAQQDVDVLAITVLNVNSPPTAPASNSVSTDEDTTSAAVAIGATDPDNDTLTYSQKSGFEAAHGTVAFDQNAGTFTYTPDPDFNGSDSFTILIDDGNGGSTEQVVSVSIAPVNDPPTAAANNSVTTAEDTASAATLIGASDVDGDTLTYSQKSGFTAAHGTVSFDQNAGTFTYTPDANFNGSDSFTIVIDDGNGGTAEQVVGVTVTPVNDAPTAPASGSVTTAEDTASAAQAIGASDLDGDTLTYSQKSGFTAAHGTVSFDQNAGTYTNTPNANYNGTDSFTILVSDGNAGTAEQVVSVTVTPVNDAPTASANNSVTTAEDTASAATSIGASDVDGDTLTYSQKAGFGPAHGAVSFDQNAGTFTYTPTVNFNGSDSFTILISDGNGGTAEQVVAVNVTPVNDAPTAPPSGSVTTAEDTASAAQAIGATDIDGDTLTYSQKSGFEAAHGSVGFNQANGTYTYTPNANFNGSDSFTILVSDGHGGTAEQAVSVTVTPVNDAPTGITGTLATPEDATNGTLVGTVVGQDPDSSHFTYQLLDDAGGRFVMDGNGNVFVHDGLLLDYEQAASHPLQVRVTDDMGASAVYSIGVNVLDVHGENVQGDARDNTFFGGVEADTLRGGDGADFLVGQGGADQLFGDNGNDHLKGGAGGDTLNGGSGNDIMDGGLGADVMTGGSGDDVYVLRKGEVQGDTITDYFSQGAATADSIVLVGYNPGTTLTHVGNGSSTTYQINDHGFVETFTIIATGQVHPTDITFAPASDWP
jgi:VCBS repeat-containing protein